MSHIFSEGCKKRQTGLIRQQLSLRLHHMNFDLPNQKYDQKKWNFSKDKQNAQKGSKI